MSSDVGKYTKDGFWLTEQKCVHQIFGILGCKYFVTFAFQTGHNTTFILAVFAENKQGS